MKSFGSIITEIRKAKNMSQTDVILHMTDRGFPMREAALSKWELDITRPNVLQFFALCEIYKIKNINIIFNIVDKDNLYAALNEEGQHKVD